jgi:hypothetical protein
MLRVSKILLIVIVISLCQTIIVAQNASAVGIRADSRETTGGARGVGRSNTVPAVQSVEVHSDRQVTFRISASQANNIRFTSSDIFNLGPKAQMTKNDNGVWETTIGPLESGAYRYNFNVDGVSTTIRKIQ